MRVALLLKRGFHGLVLLKCVQVLQEEQPRRLLGVVELARAAGILVQDVVDVLKGLFKHGGARLGRGTGSRGPEGPGDAGELEGGS